MNEATTRLDNGVLMFEASTWVDDPGSLGTHALVHRSDGNGGVEWLRVDERGVATWWPHRVQAHRFDVADVPLLLHAHGGVALEFRTVTQWRVLASK